MNSMEKDKILSEISKLPAHDLPGDIPLQDRWIGRDGEVDYDALKLRADKASPELCFLMVCVRGVTRERGRFINDVTQAVESEPVSLRDVQETTDTELASWMISSELGR